MFDDFFLKNLANQHFISSFYHIGKNYCYIGIGIGIGRYENFNIGNLSVSADKKISIIGIYRYRPIWKKAYRSTADTTSTCVCNSIIPFESMVVYSLSKDGGTSEAWASLKFRGFIKGKFLMILFGRREKIFELHLKKTHSAIPALVV